MPSPHPTEKNKKVSRACNTCRLKRKKCDGLEPCFFCTDTKVECSYSREPRRRGPPSGYLRYTETRVALLETLLGVVVLSAGSQIAAALLEAAGTLTRESKTQTQDVWDAYKAAWTASPAAARVHELAAVFAPFSPLEGQTAKALLPLKQPESAPGPDLATPAVVFPYIESFERTEVPERTADPPPTFPPEPAFAAQLSFSPPSPTSAFVPFSPCAHAHPFSPPSPVDFAPAHPPFSPRSDAGFAPPTSDADAVPEYIGAYWHTAALASPTLSTLPLAPDLPFPAPPQPDLPPPHVRATLLAAYRTHVHPAFPILASAASLSSANSTNAGAALPPMLLLATLAYTARLAPAPAHRVAADLWYEQAAALLHAALASSSFASPSFPATSFTPSYTPGGGDSSGRSGGASGGLAAVQTLLLLALRDHGRGRDAHAWRGVGTAVRVAQELGLDRLDDVASFRPSSSSSTTATSTTALTSAAAAGTVEETKDEMGRETERQGQGQEQEEQEDREWRRGLWGTAGMLDLLLALQLGRAPGAAGADALRAGLVLDVVGSTNWSSSEVGEERGEDRHRREPSLLAHTHALARILARVHYYLYLGFGAHSTSSASAVASSSALASNATGGANNRGSNTNTSAQHAKLAALRRELDAWLRALPAAFRVVLGSSYPSSSFSPYTPHSSAHPSSAAGAGGGAEGDRCGSGGVDGESERERQERERSRERRVLEANMLYHVSVALLWRPFAKDPATPHAADVFLDAASTFNILLDRYRASGADALACANPNMIYLVFTAAIAHLAGFKLRQQQASAFPASAHRQTTRVLQTQLHLLNCLEALAGMGGTWELARRCARTLDRLMEAEGMRVGAPGAVDRPFGRPGSSAGGVRPPSSGGKRKRGYSVDAEEDARKRRDVERETDGEGDMSDASGSTSTLVGHLQTHHGHAQHLNHAQTPNQNPFLGWPQHDALESLDPGAWPIASTRWVADAEPAPALWDVDRLGFGFGGGCGGFGGGGTWESDWDEALWMRAGQGQGQLFGSGGAGGLAGMGGAAGGGGGGGVFGLGMWDASAPGG